MEAIRQQKTTNELTAEYGVHTTQLTAWKKQALAAIPAAFSGKQGKVQESQPAEIDELHRQIGQLMAERDTQVAAWTAQRNTPGKTVTWRFTTADARIKLWRLYPSIHD